MIIVKHLHELLICKLPMGKPYSVLNCKRKRDSEERVIANIQRSLIPAGPIIEESDRIYAYINRKVVKMTWLLIVLGA